MAIEGQLTLLDRKHAHRGHQRARRAYPVLGICEHCRHEPARDRHHINGITDDNRPENIAALCRRCHMAADGRLDKFAALRPAFQTHCKRGHEFTEENTRWNTGGRRGYSHRTCKKCDAIRTADYQARKREEHRRRCPHHHTSREAREACERRLNADIRAA